MCENLPPGLTEQLDTIQDALDELRNKFFGYIYAAEVLEASDDDLLETIAIRALANQRDIFSLIGSTLSAVRKPLCEQTQNQEPEDSSRPIAKECESATVMARVVTQELFAVSLEVSQTVFDYADAVSDDIKVRTLVMQ